MTATNLRVAILCTGLEHVARGFESYSRGLFNALRVENIDVTLFKGSGTSTEGEVVVRCLRRDSLRGVVGHRRAYYLEQVTFAASIFPALIRNNYDVVHYSDATVGNVLKELSVVTRKHLRLLLSNGGPVSPQHIKKGVFVHQVSVEHYRQAYEFGCSPDLMHLVPYGIASERFLQRKGRAGLQDRYLIPQDSIVVLSLAALNSSHKKIDHLIREFAAARQPNTFLILAGEPSPETPMLRAIADCLLPGKCHLMSVKSEEVPDLLSVADMLVLPSAAEGFGLVLLEAMAAGVPVIANNSEHFRWIVGSAGELISMEIHGELSRAITRLANSRSHREDLGAAGFIRVAERFSWKALIPRYLEMYSRVASIGD